MVKAPFAMRSSNKNDGQNILTPVTAVTTAPMSVTTHIQSCDKVGHTHIIVQHHVTIL